MSAVRKLLQRLLVGRGPRAHDQNLARCSPHDLGRDRAEQAISDRLVLVTGSDVLAAACYAAAYTRGMRIGIDLAVTGFDGTAVSRLLAPSLTTVAIPLAAIADRVVARILGEVPNTTGELLGTEVIIGDSTGPLA